MAEKIKIKIYGFNLKQVISYLIDKGVLVCDLKIKSKYIIFVINSKDKFMLDKYCEVYKKQYQILKSFSLKESVKNLRFKFGMIVALILVVCYVLSFNCLVFDINVYNKTNVDFDLSLVKKVLNDNGIKEGSYIGKDFNKQIEDVIINNIENVAGCSVEFNGGKLNLTIVPESKKITNSQKQLFSKYDAVITDIEVFSGNGKFVIGDVVKKGDLIVNSNDGANAMVNGNVYFSSSYLHNRINQKIKYTGKYIVNKKFSLFNKILYKTQNMNQFSNYLTKKCDFYIMENYLLPIKCQSEYLFEYKIIEQIIEFEELENDLKEKLYNEVYLKIPKNAKVLNTYYSVVKDGNLTRLDCFIEANVSLV